MRRLLGWEERGKRPSQSLNAPLRNPYKATPLSPSLEFPFVDRGLRLEMLASVVILVLLEPCVGTDLESREVMFASSVVEMPSCLMGLVLLHSGRLMPRSVHSFACCSGCLLLGVGLSQSEGSHFREVVSVASLPKRLQSCTPVQRRN